MDQPPFSLTKRQQRYLEVIDELLMWNVPLTNRLVANQLKISPEAVRKMRQRHPILDAWIIEQYRRRIELLPKGHWRRRVRRAKGLQQRAPRGLYN